MVGMPWCGTCDRYLSPPTVNVDGTCPECGAPVDAATHEHVPAGTSPTDKQALPPVPWHFKLLCAAVVVYLGYRFAQMGEWLLHRL
jgi:hypothetical protein